MKLRNTKQAGSTGLGNISVLLIVCTILVSASSRSIGQNVILLDSSQSTRAITDLELGDKCKEEKQLLLEEIDLLEQTRTELSGRIEVKDSIIVNYMRIDTAYQEINLLMNELNDTHRKEIKREKRKKIPWIAGAAALLTYGIIKSF